VVMLALDRPRHVDTPSRLVSGRFVREPELSS
jgi:hypothetical protein